MRCCIERLPLRFHIFQLLFPALLSTQPSRINQNRKIASGLIINELSAVGGTSQQKNCSTTGGCRRGCPRRLGGGRRALPQPLPAATQRGAAPAPARGVSARGCPSPLEETKSSANDEASVIHDMEVLAPSSAVSDVPTQVITRVIAAANDVNKM